jgi:hypothetical protein
MSPRPFLRKNRSRSGVIREGIMARRLLLDGWMTEMILKG